ncbi:MAG: hypothetical protein ACU85E_07685 [Gammaproteobacteria bacterium]
MSAISERQGLKFIEGRSTIPECGWALMTLVWGNHPSDADAR